MHLVTKTLYCSTSSIAVALFSQSQSQKYHLKNVLIAATIQDLKILFCLSLT